MFFLFYFLSFFFSVYCKEESHIKEKHHHLTRHMSKSKIVLGESCFIYKYNTDVICIGVKELDYEFLDK